MMSKSWPCSIIGFSLLFRVLMKQISIFRALLVICVCPSVSQFAPYLSVDINVINTNKLIFIELNMNIISQDTFLIVTLSH
jgi:hypothetical protein